MKDDLEINIVILGDHGVGKTSLINTFIEGLFVDKYNPYVDDSSFKNIKMDGREVVIYLMEPMYRQFSSIKIPYIELGDGFVLVYSILCKYSFEELEELRKEIKRVKDGQDFPILIVGNKVDCEDERVIAKNEAEELAIQWKCYYIETSAKTSVNVDDVFLELTRSIIQRRDAINKETSLKIKQIKKKRGKCLMF